MFGKNKESKAQKPQTETPAQAQPNPQDPPPTQVDVYTLPEKFLPTQKTVGQKNSGGNKMMYILLGFLVVVIIAGAAAWFYYNKNQNVEEPTQMTNIAPLEEESTVIEETTTPEEVEEEPEEIVHIAKDSLGNVIGIINIDLGKEDYNISDQVEITSGQVLDDKKVVGAYYRIMPSSYSLKEKATIRITYFDAALSSLVENSLRVGYEGSANGEWSTAEDSAVDLSKNEVTLEIMQLPRTRIALISNITIEEEEEEEEIDENEYEVSELKPSLDTDGDYLTDVEEIMYGTKFNLPDSDSDGYVDGAEMLSLYSPLEVGQTLAESELFTSYTSDSFEYELIYPASWSPSSIDENGSVIIFSSATSQFVEVVVEEKEEGIETIADWYKKQVPGIDEDSLVATTVGPDKIEAIYSLDGSAIYFLYKNWVIAFSYNLGIESEADYATTWGVMVNSWKATEEPAPEEVVEEEEEVVEEEPSE